MPTARTRAHVHARQRGVRAAAWGPRAGRACAAVPAGASENEKPRSMTGAMEPLDRIELSTCSLRVSRSTD